MCPSAVCGRKKKVTTDKIAVHLDCDTQKVNCFFFKRNQNVIGERTEEKKNFHSLKAHTTE